jgi:hypothetical protein
MATGKFNPSPARAKTYQVVLEEIEKEHAQLYALAATIAGKLQPVDPKSPPDDWPLNEWRLAEVLEQRLEKTTLHAFARHLLMGESMSQAQEDAQPSQQRDERTAELHRLHAPAAEADALREALRECDGISQGAGDAISTMARAARRSLALDAGALEDVRTLLLEIESRAAALSNDVNATAEVHGANFIDERGRKETRALWDQHHALRGTPEVP